MMMECPRCAFVQPQDRFCANCGLNVATYQAKPKPLSQRLLSNPALYLGLGVLFLVFVGWFLKQSKIAPVDRTVVEQSAPVAGGAMPGTPQVPSAQPDLPAPQANVQRTAVLPAEVAATESTPAGAAAGAAGASTAASSPVVPPVVKMPTQVDLSFYEIARETWQPAAAEGKSLGDQGGWRILQFATKEKLTAALGSARRLPGQRSMATQPSSNASLHFPSGPAEAHQGMFFDFSVVKSDAGSLDIEVTGQIQLKLDASTEIANSVNTMAALPGAGAVVMVGSFTRKTPPESIAGLLTGSPLSVLNSLDFVEGQSDLILVITGR